ncbi:hypothetical protein [Paenibacillus gallinarum]|uniref:Uncharacterized protein n=1 Tax=Paenibacillus gallinarum TaxID=2762232 RepID=A0ABR8T5B9_9BACL|nr:hypothetical protein [Paenibacillus gallinarum]MBD7970738.1 hypothetical protein [Paenibacillus gallinarum]
MNEPKIEVISRRRYRNLFAMGIYSFLMGGYQALIEMDRNYIHIFTVITAVLFLFELGLLLYQWSVKPKSIQLHKGQLIIGNRIFRADELKSIIIEEYYGPHIGIKPKNKMLVPMRLAFRVLDKHKADHAFNEIHEWGERNEVPVLTQRMWTL